MIYLLDELEANASQAHGHQGLGTVSEKTVTALLPLSAMLGYSKILRSLTKGNAKFSMQLHGYGEMLPNKTEKVLREFRGH
jgi:translation elongation factor EF-G